MARLFSIVTFALICIMAVGAYGQEPAPEEPASEEPAPEEPAPAKPAPAKPAPAEPAPAEPAPAKPAPAKPAPAKKKPAKKKPAKKKPAKKKNKRGKSPETAPTGAIVVAIGAEAQPHARSLARAVYQDAILRPRIDEAAAQVLSGGEPPEGNAQLERHASVVHALGTTSDEEVQRRLAGSLARDLHARLIVLVTVKAGEPTARVVRMPEERMLAVKLTARKKKSKKDPPEWDWKDATSMMRELSIGAPPPGPRKKKKDAGGTATKTPESDDSEDDGNLLTSPWFWGGLGLVVTVGATVLILSQTALNEPDVVMIDGRVTP